MRPVAMKTGVGMALFRPIMATGPITEQQDKAVEPTDTSLGCQRPKDVLNSRAGPLLSRSSHDPERGSIRCRQNGSTKAPRPNEFGF